MSKFNLGDYVIVSVAGASTSIHGVIVKPIGNDCYIVNIDGINTLCHESQIRLLKAIKHSIGDKIQFRATIPVILKGIIIGRCGNEYIVDAVDDININEDSLNGLTVKAKDIVE